MSLRGVVAVGHFELRRLEARKARPGWKLLRIHASNLRIQPFTVLGIEHLSNSFTVTNLTFTKVRTITAVYYFVPSLVVIARFMNFSAISFSDDV